MINLIQIKYLFTFRRTVLFQAASRRILQVLHFSLCRQLGHGNRIHFRELSSETSSAYDPYRVLNVEPGASLDDIRNSYFELSKKFHPDYNPGSEKAKEQFILLTNAYRTLVEKVVNEQTLTGDSDTHAKKGGREQEKLKYDFTISPLGIETEPEKQLSLMSIIKKVIMIALLLYCLNFVGSKLSFLMNGDPLDWRFREKTEQQLEDEAAERIRKAIIEQHRKQQDLKGLYATAAGGNDSHPNARNNEA